MTSWVFQLPLVSMGRLGLWTGIVTLVFIGSSVARAYTLNSEDPSLRGWNTDVLRVNYNPSGCPEGFDLRGALEAALSAWNGVAGAEIRLELGSTSTTDALAARSGAASDAPVIACDQGFRATTAMDGDSVPGVGGISVNTETHRIVYGYAILNSERATAAAIDHLDANRTVVVIAHELGHVLGLGHSADRRALMYPNVSDLPAPVLSSDDQAGLRRLYPPGGRDDGGGLVGCGSMKSTGPPNAQRLFSFVFLLTLCAWSAWAIRLTK